MGETKQLFQIENMDRFLIIWYFDFCKGGKFYFLHFPGIFHHAVNNLFTVQIIFFTGFYKENLKKCVENRSVKICFPKSVWKIFSTLILENQCGKLIFHTDFGKQIFTLLFSTHFLLQNTDLEPG